LHHRRPDHFHAATPLSASRHGLSLFERYR
jgi:hypothetical protein